MDPKNAHKIKAVSVFGLGKLGSPILASFASKGYGAVGFDVVPAAVNLMNAHQAPVVEPGLQDLIDANRGRISATTDATQAVLTSDASFVVVPTPSNPDGAFTSKFVVEAMEKIGAALKNKNGYHLVSVVSTVMPGASDTEIVPALEKASGKKAGKDFGYVYSPTLIALGSVVRDFLNPELVMIGTHDAESGKMLEALYRTVLGSNPVYHHVTPAEAELAKIALNTYITTKISFANMLGMIAENMNGVRVDNVTKILGSDARVGPKYLRAGASYGGPCFPRDNRALTRAAQLAKVETFIPQATDRTNQAYVETLAAKAILAGAASGKKVAVIGVAYKPNTEVVDEGMGLHLAKYFVKNNIPVVVHDPYAQASARRVLGDTVEYDDTVEGALAKADIVMITNPYKDIFEKLHPKHLDGKAVIDCWNVVPSSRTS